MRIILMITPLHPKLQAFKVRGAPSLGIHVVGSVLRNNGYDDEIRFCDEVKMEKYYQDGWDENKIRRLIEGYDIIGISATSFNWGTSRELIEVIKKRKDAPFVMCGGVHPTYFDEHILRTTKADLVVRGDSENNITKVVDAIKHKKSFHHIPGVSFRDGDKIIQNPMESEKKFIDTHISCYEEMLDNLYLYLPLETSRGCKYSCVFCSIPHRKNWRALDFGGVVKKIDHALNYLDKVKLKRLNFVDDYFCGDLQRTVDILGWINNNNNEFKVSYEARCNDFLNKKIDLAASLSDKTSEFHMGIDSLYDEGLRKIGKGFLVKDVEECFRKLNDYGLMKKVTISTLVGFPWENLSDCLKTINFANYLKDKYRIEMYRIYWWMPMVSRIWEKQDEYGFRITESIFDDPTWLARKELIYPMHPKLSSSDIELLDLHTDIPMKSLLGEEEGMKGIEI